MAKTLSFNSARIWFDTADPGLSETGVATGNLWLNTSTGNGFVCADPTFGAQIWNPSAFVSPLSPTKGGTGLSGVTAHSLLVGNGSSAVSLVGVGSTGTVLSGATGADPTFSATPSVTSITLNGGTALGAYLEQQSFTPTIIGSTGAGAGTYTLQAGYYTLIGNMVFVAIEITWTAHTGTGDLWVGNLPFTIRNSANYSPEGVVNTINMTLPGGANRTSIGSGVAGTTHIIVEVPTNAGANSPVQMQASGTIHATLTYLT